MNNPPDRTQKALLSSILIGVLVWLACNAILFPALTFLIFSLLNLQPNPDPGDMTMLSFLCAGPVALLVSLFISLSIGRRVYRSKLRR